MSMLFQPERGASLLHPMSLKPAAVGTDAEHRLQCVG
jgi:hypothetical protein